MGQAPGPRHLADSSCRKRLLLVKDRKSPGRASWRNSRRIESIARIQANGSRIENADLLEGPARYRLQTDTEWEYPVRTGGRYVENREETTWDRGNGGG